MRAWRFGASGSLNHFASRLPGGIRLPWPACLAAWVASLKNSQTPARPWASAGGLPARRLGWSCSARFQVSLGEFSVWIEVILRSIWVKSQEWFASRGSITNTIWSLGRMRSDVCGPIGTSLAPLENPDERTWCREPRRSSNRQAIPFPHSVWA